MDLQWTFDYVKIDEEFQVASSRVYKNGEYFGEVDAQEKVMLVSYLTLFPSKDIVQIKLGTTQSALYNILYIDKRFKDQNFIGVFSFAEFNTFQPFIWGKEEEIMKDVFSKFTETFPKLFSSNGSYDGLDKLNEYYTWMDEKISNFYNKWMKAKEEFYGNKNNEIKESLAQTFSNLSIAAEKKKKNKKDVIDYNMIVGDMLYNKKVKGLDTDTYTYEWDIQLINSYGHPLTRIEKFRDGKYIEIHEKQELLNQGLEAMSYSVLKSIVESKNRNLRHIKICYNNKGYEYVYFQNVNFDDNNFLIIMRCAMINKKTEFHEDLLLGGERLTLERIAYHMSQNHQDWFKSSDFAPGITNGAEKIRNLFINDCKKYF